jgi:hypothetical protein
MASSATREVDLAKLLPVAAVEPDGLLLTTDGRYVRAIECESVPNPVSAGEDTLTRITNGWAALCAQIPDRQGLCFLVQTDPLPVEEALADDRRKVQVAIDDDRRHGRSELAVTRRRLLAAEAETVHAAAAALAAPAVRYFVIVPWVPELALRDQVAGLRPAPGGVRRTSWPAHQRAARESLRYADAMLGALSRLGVRGRLVGPVEQLAYLWERLHPGADRLPDFERLHEAARILCATTPQEARATRAELLDLLGDGAGWSVRENAGALMRHRDGTVEEVLHLGTQPAATSPWWLSYLLETPLPSTLAVHISVDDRARARHRERRRWARLRTALDYKHRRGQLIGHAEREGLEEAEELDAELSSSAQAALYRVSICFSCRQPDGEAETLDELLGALAREFSGLTDARVLRGRWLNVDAFVSTLPIGEDRLGAQRRYAHRNIADCVPLASAASGFSTGLLLGWSDPQRLLVRVNPFDSLLQTHVTLVCGPSGGGKTVATNALLARAISQGMRGFIVDRSSTASEDRSQRAQGHYEPLIDLVPGARKIYLGTGSGAVICPWDTPDPGNVPAEKIEFLKALHALLIGERHGEDRELSALDEALIARGIDAVYERCAATGERPRETLLGEQMTLLADADGGERIDPMIASAYRSLVARLHPYIEGGASAHLTDRETTVAADVPLVLFDIAGTPERLIGAVVLTIVDHIDREVQRTRARRVSGTLDDRGAWAGSCFCVVEEGWKLTETKAAGAWLNEYARRSRHYALWLIFVTQHLKDLATEQGQALLESAQLRILFRNTRKDLTGARDALGLTDTDIDTVVELETHKGLYSSCYLISPRGRGKVRIALGNLEYWICSNDPERDQPRRRAALEQTDGNPWAALQLLCSPEWHQAHDTGREAA